MCFGFVIGPHFLGRLGCIVPTKMQVCVFLLGICVGVWMFMTPGPSAPFMGNGVPQSMQAAVFRDYGAAADVVSVDNNAALPAIGPTDVVIRVRASAINPVDFKIIKGVMRLISPWVMPHPPRVPGFDVAGEIVAVGAHVADMWKVGEEVFAMADFRRCGTLAEYVAIESELVARKPRHVDWHGAASLPLVATTGYKALIRSAGLESGQSVLILGASGGTGSFGVQLAKALGAKVTATCSPRNFELVRGLGADEVVDYRTTDWGTELAGRNFDVVYDCIGGRAHWVGATKVLKPGGQFVTIVGDEPSLGLSSLLSKGVGIATRQRFLSGFHYHLITAFPDGAILAEIAQLVDEGRISPVVDSVFPLSQAAQALDYLSQGHATGKVVVVPDPQPTSDAPVQVPHISEGGDRQEAVVGVEGGVQTPNGPSAAVSASEEAVASDNRAQQDDATPAVEEDEVQQPASRKRKRRRSKKKKKAKPGHTA